MKFKHLESLALVAGTAWMSAALAQTPPRYVDFTGTVHDVSCTATFNGTGNEDGVISLGGLNKKDNLQSQASAGKTFTEGEVSFTLNVNACDYKNVMARIHFYNEEAGAIVSGRLNKTDQSGTGSGWRIELAHEDENLMASVLSSSVPNFSANYPGVVLDGNGNGVFKYVARYHRPAWNNGGAQIVAGKLTTSVSYVLFFN